MHIQFNAIKNLSMLKLNVPVPEGHNGQIGVVAQGCHLLPFEWGSDSTCPSDERALPSSSSTLSPTLISVRSVQSHYNLPPSLHSLASRRIAFASVIPKAGPTDNLAAAF